MKSLIKVVSSSSQYSGDLKSNHLKSGNIWNLKANGNRNVAYYMTTDLGLVRATRKKTKKNIWNPETFEICTF